MTIDSAQLPGDASNQLRSLEAKIGRRVGDAPAYEAGEALKAIHDQRLYVARGFATFEEYARERWEMKRQTAYDYVHAAEVWRSIRLTVRGLIPMMHAASLYGLPVSQRIELAQRIVDQHISIQQLRVMVADMKRSRPDAIVTPSNSSTSTGKWWIEQADAADPPFQDLDLIVHSPPYGCIPPERAEALEYVEYHDYDEYRRRLLPAWAQAMHRAAAPWGRLAVVVAVDISRPRREPLAAHWANALENAGWHYRTWFHWWEGNISRSVARGTMGPAAPHVICPMEAVLVYHKAPQWSVAEVRKAHPTRWGPPDLTKFEWIQSTMGAWEIAGQRAAEVGGFPAAYPRELVRRIVKLLSFPHAKVGDFFVGSGTTGEVAVELGRHFYGAEISKRWVDFARDRVRTASRATAA